MNLRLLVPHFLALTSFFLPAEVLFDREGKGIFLDHNLAETIENEGDSPLPAPDPVGDDLVLFHNGDLMHGSFGGIDNGLFWNRQDISRPIRFKVPSVKQIILSSAQGVQMNQHSSHIHLVSGDRIPGEILALDAETITLESPVLGELNLPRAHVRSIVPNPFNGELYYLGPYTSEGWVVLDQKTVDGPDDQKKSGGDSDDEESKKSSPWIHSGVSFYSLSSQPLVLPEARLPDKGRVRFQASWKGRFNLTVALHSDLIRVLPRQPDEGDEKEEVDDADREPGGAGQPDGKDQDGEPEKENADGEEEEQKVEPLPTENLADLRKGTGFQAIPWTDSLKKTHADVFGTGYTINLYSSYPSLQRNLFTETGTALQDRIGSARTNVGLAEDSEAEIELRFDREKAIIMLFINGKYAAQWNDTKGYLGEGRSLGFKNNSSSKQPIRLSEIVVSSWSGVTDSAESMQHPDRDIVLLTNGTDRISGTLSGIAEGQATLVTEYGEAKIPLSNLSEINLRESARTDLEKDGHDFEWATPPVTVVYQPFGRVKLNPASATTDSITGRSPFLGEITADLKSAIMLRFSSDSPDLADWFEEF